MFRLPGRRGTFRTGSNHLTEVFLDDVTAGVDAFAGSLHVSVRNNETCLIQFNEAF